MHSIDKTRWRTRTAIYACLCALSFPGANSSARADDDQQQTARSIRTATPIKHVIIIVGENRSFDHLFATYIPTTRRRESKESSLGGIVNRRRLARVEFCESASVPDHVRAQ